MLFEPPSLTEKEWDKLKMTALSAIVVGLVRAVCGTAKDLGTEAIRRRLGWVDEPDDDDDEPPGDE